MQKGGMRMRMIVVSVSVALLTGCSAESTRVAIEAQQRANEVQEAVFDRQHDGLVTLLYRDLAQKLDAMADEGAALNDAQRGALNAAWNERDLVEFWRVQYERSKALRLIGVDAKLYSDQAVVDLLIKALTAKVERGKQAIAATAGAAVADQRVSESANHEDAKDAKKTE
jgi:hypothetical protein